MENNNLPSDICRLTSILMIQPVSFGFNEETALNNYFQQKKNIEDAQSKALDEFNAFVDKLRTHAIDVTVILDTPAPQTPDSIFPNNWISFHEGGRIVLCPMFAKNRRMERKKSVIEFVSKKFQIQQQIDLTHFEDVDKFLEGTGSMVLDRDNKIAYACISERTDPEIMNAFCIEFGYTPILFNATDRNDKLIYHTNVMMCMADNYVIVCMDSLKSEHQKNLLIDLFARTNKKIVEIDFDQMDHFCGNMLQVRNVENQQFLVMSSQAFNHLTAKQINTLESFNPIIHSSIDTIETLGGGSARCMMAEIFE
jgi:hypothetical protein